MKKLFKSLALATISVAACAQTNGFVIGIINSTYYTTYGSNGLVNTATSGGYPTSPHNTLKDDGFNLSTFTGPDNSLTYFNYKNYMKLCDNNQMKFSDAGSYWYRPTPPANYVQCAVPTNQIPGPPQYSLQFNDGPSGSGSGAGSNYMSNAVYSNFDDLYKYVYNDPTISTNLYMHDIGGEFMYFHLFPKYDPNAPTTGMSDPNNPAYCDGFPNNPPACICSSGVQKYFPAEVPPAAVNSALQYFKGKTTTQSGHKYAIAMATHNDSYVNLDNNNLAPWHQAPYNGVYFNHDYLLYSYGANKPDIIREASYYNGFYDWTTTNSFISYMGKFDNIDYLHAHAFDKIIAENDVATNFGENSHELHSNPPVYSNGTLKPGIPNGNMLRFLTFTSIMHGVDGITLYTLPDMFNDGTHPLEFYDLSNGTDMTNRNKWLNGSQALSDRFQRGNFPYLYQNFVYKLAREVRYLANANLIAPYGYNLNGFKIVTVKAKTSLGSAQITPTVTPGTSTLPYLPASVSGADANDLIAAGLGAGPFTNNHRGEDFGLQYMITTNGTDAIMIVTNPNPYSIHNISFNFNNKTFGTAAFDNTILPNTKAMDVLFEDGLVTDVTSASYKTDPSASVDDGNSSPAYKLLKKYSIPFCNKTFTSDFGPFDVKIFKFNTTSYDGNAAFNVAGWLKKWSNNGDGSIGGIWGGPGNLSSTDKFVPFDFDGDGDEELLCVQSINSGGPNSPPNAWATVLDWNGTAWTLKWSNFGNGCFNGGSTQGQYAFTGWGIRAADKYIVGDFDNDGKNNDLLCAQGDGLWNTIMHATGSNFSWYWSNNGGAYLTQTGNWPWGITATDRFMAGDFDGDGKNNDLLCVQKTTGGQWDLLHFASGAFTSLWGGNGHLFNIQQWPVDFSDEYFVGDFDGNGSRDEVFCVNRGAREAVFKKNTGMSASTEWIDQTGIMPGWGVALTDKIVTGDIDASESTSPVKNKDEIMLIQNNGGGSGWATTEDLNTANTSPQWNWSNHNGGYPTGTQNYIGDWLVADPCAVNPNYIFIKPVLADKKYLLAFKNYQNNTYLISMYKTNGNYNYRELNTESEIAMATTSGFDFKLFPNPNSGSFTISSGNTNQKSVIITDLVGKTIYESSTAEMEVNIKMPDGTKGVYFIKLVDGDKTGIKKVIVE